MTFLNKGYNRQDFIAFLADKFLPEDFEQGVREIALTRNQNFTHKAYRLGRCNSLQLEVFEIHHTSSNDARVGIAKDAFQILLHHSFCNRALVAFVPAEGAKWRFSLLQIDAELSETNRLQHSYSNPRRYSFLIGENALVKTPTQFLIDKGRVRQRTENGKSITPWEDLQSRFSVEALTKEFYTKLFNWYQWALSDEIHVTFPNNISTDTDDRDKLEIKLIRLITRMLFVWFIKQKHLVPQSLFNLDYLGTILRNFDPKSVTDGCYYNAILQNLFFATLNQEIGQRKVFRVFRGKSENYGNKQLYRDTVNSYFTFTSEEHDKRIISLFEDVPYLNGGLFECLDKYKLEQSEDGKQGLKPDTNYDGFSHSDERINGNFKKKAFVPNILFFNDDEQQPGLINLFAQYNFTVEENTSTDKEVSLDPELLGRVFENLLAAYNPETQDTARKSTGSFYTPRPIVDYMVNEALKAYLINECGNDAEQIRKLIEEESVPQVSNPEKIVSDLKKVKILDPACGSGAFPMGLLLKITELIEKLTPSEKFNRYLTKLDIIKNCIYGIDVQPIAMLICKLRFFISLICDSEKDITKDNFGIIPLPNLETKFITADTLKSAKIKQFQDDWAQDEHLKQLKDELLNLRLTIVDKVKCKDKVANKQADQKKCKEIAEYLKSVATEPNAKTIELNEKQISEYQAELKKYKTDYWIDEAKQEQSLFDDGQIAIFRRNPNKEKRDELNAKIRKCQEAIDKERAKATLTGFEDAVTEVTKWDPYDQTKSYKFFDPEWMFGIQDGFDIVIGNPPYIQLEKNSGELAKKYDGYGYRTFARTGDIYCLFYERGWQLLKEGGHLCYITSNKWMRTGYGEKTRAFFVSSTNPKLLVDFGGIQVFDSAVVDTNIILIERAGNKNLTQSVVASTSDEDDIRNNLSAFVQQNKAICSFTTSDSWVILSPIEQSIKRKIEAVGTPLKDWDIQIYRGVLTGCNEAFIISTEKRNEILANCSTDDERKRTDELIRPILRGRDIKRYGYDWANLYLIATFPSRHYAIDDYPAVKRYLLSYAKDTLLEHGYDWVAERHLADFCKQKLSQTGKVIEIAGKKIKFGQSYEKARKRTTNKWFETQDSISYWEYFISLFGCDDEGLVAAGLDSVVDLDVPVA